MSGLLRQFALAELTAWRFVVFGIAAREYWFETAKDVLFAVEFLLVQVYLIYHIVRALFFPERKRRRPPR